MKPTPAYIGIDVVEALDDPAIGGGIRHTADMLATYLNEHDSDAHDEGERSTRWRLRVNVRIEGANAS